MLPGSDLLATGSCDGVVRLWDVDTGAGSLTPVGGVPMVRALCGCAYLSGCNSQPYVGQDGFVNGVQFARSGKFMVAAVGQVGKLAVLLHRDQL